MPKFDVFSDSAELPATNLCSRVWFQESVDEFAELIDKNYGWSPALDRVPAALRTAGEEEADFSKQIPLGYEGIAQDGSKVHYIYNHMDMIVKLGLVGNKD